jgi:hypothetical protein
MALLPPGARDPSAHRIGLALAAAVPLAAYLVTGSFHDYWLDSGEFTAQAIRLDIAHPPGHPVAGLLGRLAALLPIGSLGLRVALAEGLCTAGAAALLFRALDATVRVQGVARETVAIPLALGGTWLVACSYAWWFQAVRPEVYGLQALLTAAVVERTVHLEARWPTLDLRPVDVGALCLGLGLANHHLVAFLTFPALLPTVVRLLRARGPTVLLRPFGYGLVGLASYAYLPLRAAAAPLANLGDPQTVDRLFWVVSARVYQQNKGGDAPQPLAERLVDVLRLLGETFGGDRHDDLQVVLGAFVALGAALLGAYVLLRTPGVRRVGGVWVGLALSILLGPALLMSVRSNPDVLGYMMLGFGAVAALATCFVAALVARLGQRPDGSPHAVGLGVALAVAALGLAQLQASVEDASLAEFHYTDDFDEARVRRLPTGAVVIAHRPQTVFRHWSVTAQEGLRTDVTLVPMPFLDYPGVMDALRARDGDLEPLLDAYRQTGQLGREALEALAAERPVLLELDPLVGADVFPIVEPAGLFHAVGPGDLLAREETIGALYRHLGPGGPTEVETRNELVWLHYMEALHHAARGRRDAARVAVRRARALSPSSPELAALEAALESGHGPLDIGPFVVGRRDAD